MQNCRTLSHPVNVPNTILNGSVPLIRISDVPEPHCVYINVKCMKLCVNVCRPRRVDGCVAHWLVYGVFTIGMIRSVYVCINSRDHDIKTIR